MAKIEITFNAFFIYYHLVQLFMGNFEIFISADNNIIWGYILKVVTS